MRFAPIFLVLALCLELSACGIRGPLYLPDQTPAKHDQNQSQPGQDKK